MKFFTIYCYITNSRSDQLPVGLIAQLTVGGALGIGISEVMGLSHNPGLSPVLGPVSRKPRKLFGPVKPLQNLEPCDYRAVSFTYPKDEGRFPSYKKFQAYTLLRF